MDRGDMQWGRGARVCGRGGGGGGTQKKRVWRNKLETPTKRKKKVIKLCVVRPRANPAGDGEGLPRRRCVQKMVAGAPSGRSEP